MSKYLSQQMAAGRYVKQNYTRNLAYISLGYKCNFTEAKLKVDTNSISISTVKQVSTLQFC